MSLLTFLANAQFEVKAVNQENVEGVRGGSLTLKWIFSGIPKNYEVSISNLYFNVTKVTPQARICIWNSVAQTPSVSQIGKNIFGDRINASYANDTYNFTITDLQYKDAGPYLLQAGVSPEGDVSFLQTNSSTIIISQIAGEYEFRI